MDPMIAEFHCTTAGCEDEFEIDMTGHGFVRGDDEIDCEPCPQCGEDADFFGWKD